MPISAQFTADFSQFTAAADEAKTALGGVRTAADEVHIEQAAATAGTAIRNLAGEVTTFATDYIKAFAEEEAATGRLTAALRDQGTATTDTIANYQAMAEQFQTTTRYSDDAVTAAQTALTQIGRIGPEQMQPAIQAAANLAASLGIGIEEAAKKLGIVIGSDGAKLGTLKKYLGDVELKGKDASEILAIFNSKFGGAAAADMETTNGKLQNLNNKLDDFKGKVGEVLSTALTPLLDAFGALPAMMQTLILGGGALVLALTPVAIAFGSVVTALLSLATAILGPAGVTAALTALGALLTPAGLIIAGAAAVYLVFRNWDKIVDIARSVYEGIKTWLVDRFSAIVASVTAKIDAIIAKFRAMMMAVTGGSYVPDMVAGIAQEFGKLDRVMVRPAVEAAGAVTGAMGGLAGPSLATAGSGVAVNNVFHLVDTESNLARRVGDEIARSVLQGRKLSGL